MLNNVLAWYSALWLSFLFVTNVISAVGNGNIDNRVASFVAILLHLPLMVFVALHLPL